MLFHLDFRGELCNLVSKALYVSFLFTEGDRQVSAHVQGQRYINYMLSEYFGKRYQQGHDQGLIFSRY